MADATEVLISNAVVAELNDPTRAWASSLTGGSAATLLWLPVYTADDLYTAGVPNLKVAVVPLTMVRYAQSRGGRTMYDYVIAVDIQKHVLQAQLSTSIVTIDALAFLSEQIQQFYTDFHTLATLPAWRVIGSEREDVYDLGRMYEGSAFYTFVALKVRGWR